jgi:hypothetical protein
MSGLMHLTLCFLDTACQFTFKRTMKSSIVYDSEPRSVVVGDVNNDHKMDIIVANPGTNNIGIFLSNGYGNFTPQQTYSTGSQSLPYAAVVHDFDNDKNLDIAVACYGTNNIGIFLGYGNGTFSDQNLFSLGSSRPLFIAASDFNNDNQADIVVVNYGTDSIGILLGYGDGTFQNMIIYPTDYDSIPYSLAVGDFNNDNNSDIAVTNYGTSNVGIFLGYGDGTFANQQIYTTLPKSNPCSIVVADFNNDNYSDMAVANNGTGNIGIFFGHGNGTFEAQVTYLISSNLYPQYITVGDFNNDNKVDIVIVDSKNNELYVLLGSGNGIFPEISTYDVASGSTPFWVAVADFNNDFGSDIVFTNRGVEEIRTLIGYSAKPSVRTQSYPVGTALFTGAIVISDFNNDHILDMVFNKLASVVVWIGVGDGTFGRQITLLIGNLSNVQYIAAGDLNNDNGTDIVISDLGYNSVFVFLGYGNGTFSTLNTYYAGAGSTPSWVAIADINNDNRQDIVSVNTGTNTLGFLLGNGDGTFAGMVLYSTGDGSIPYAAAVGDINHDNRSDIVVASWNGYIIVLLGRGNTTFTTWKIYFVGAYFGTFSIVLTDFNSDNNLDIAAANVYGYSICVLLGYGDGTFAKPTLYSTGFSSQPFYVIVADFNYDNIYDIATNDYANDLILIFFGYGNGSFVFARNYSTGTHSSPYGFAAADLDNNKQLEIIVTLSSIGYIAVLTQYNSAAFTNQSVYPTGSALQSFSLAVGDFNNDKKEDIVVANTGTDNLGIFFGFGNGTFGLEMMYPIGTDYYPQYVITIDINNDNHLDIVSVNSEGNSISVIMGYGNGTFAEQLVLPTTGATSPYAVASGDLNNDTRLDLIIANEGSDTIGIFYGFTYTTFLSYRGYGESAHRSPLVVIVSDFNNDNYSDIAVTYYGTNEIGIILGYGTGSFTNITSYSTGANSMPWGIVAGDFNNDNLLDIVVANTGTDNIGVFLGYGNGSFATIVTYSLGQSSSPIAVDVGDLNGDGHLDIVETNSGTDSVGVLFGYGNGTFFVSQIYSTGQGSQPFSVALGDFDNDSRLDIVVANYDNDSVGVLLGYGNGTFRNQTTIPTGFYSRPYSVTVVDFNGDHRLDIAVANSNNDNVGILLGYGDGTFATIMFYATGQGSSPRCVRVGDFNNDTILDIAVASAGTDYVFLLYGSGDGYFLLGAPFPTGIATQPFGLAVGNFNNDSRLDIAVAASATSTIQIYLGNISRPFAGMATFATDTGSQPHSIAVGDLNNDGRLDIVVANYGTDNVGIFLGISSTSFATMIKCPTGTGSAPYSVAIADFDNNHRLDIVVTNSQTNNIAIFFGYGNGTFASGVTYSTGVDSRPYTVTTGDFDNDNITDIVVANSGTSNIFLFYGSINGTFEKTASYPLGYEYQPYSVVAKDLNQDNWTDIAIACYGTNHIEALVKMC